VSASPPNPRKSEVGLCAGCLHARVQESGRGSTFWRCGQAGARTGVPKYPSLPVLACDLHEPGTPSAG
jgi:hypothetical protein